MPKFPPHRLSLLLIIAFVLTLCFAPLAVNAQTQVNVTQSVEYKIGFDCPVTATLSPDATILWVLMDNCYNSGFNMLGFNVADGTPVQADANHFTEVLMPLKDMWIYADTRPMAFTPDGIVDLRYNDGDTYDSHNIRLSVTGGEATASDLTQLTNETVQQLIPGFAGYTETISYSPDHKFAVIPDTTTFHIIDLKTGKDLFQIDSQPTTDYSRAVFSADNQHLFISTLKKPDDMQDDSSTLAVYDVSDGKLVKTYDVPTYTNVISPDERYIVGRVGGQFDAGIVVTNLETGSFSDVVLINEPPHLVTECLNTGEKVSGVNFKTRGELPILDIVWMPDSSGFFTVNSYLGDVAAGGTICIFNTSRLRQYKVG
ncbi:MAG: hypothetical protein GC179_09470 [Anaerolineaceae bacterium]|nr:hypothetical protein [Anaerolineaceae bacterium]